MYTSAMKRARRASTGLLKVCKTGEHTKSGIKCCDIRFAIRYTLMEGREIHGLNDPHEFGTCICGREPYR